MEIKYFVVEAYRYRASGGWEYALKGMYDTLSAAKQAYHSRLAAIIKQSNDHAMVVVVDSYGNRIMGDYDNTAVTPEPEPEVEGE